jgi:hypothetical protein
MSSSHPLLRTRSRRQRGLGTWLVAAAALPGWSAGAAVLWDGSASKGMGVFDGVECVQGTVTAVQDPSYGAVWRIFFPDGDKRCEVRGSTGYEFKNDGGEVYVGWRSRYDVADGTLRYVFQMKGYPTADKPLQANHPIVFGTEHNRLVLINYDLSDQRHDVWKADVTRTEWVSIVLHMKMSDDPKVGFIELWFNGAKQMLTGGTDRYPANTFDGGQTRIKWGIYREGQGPGDCIQYLASPKIGAAYEDVAPSGSSSPPGDAGVRPEPGPFDASSAPSPDAAATPDVAGAADRPMAPLDVRVRAADAGVDDPADPGDQPPPGAGGAKKAAGGCATGGHWRGRSGVPGWPLLAGLLALGWRRRRLTRECAPSSTQG